MQPPAKRVVLITGANKGIGLEIARQIGRTGARVLLGARDHARGQTAAAALEAEAIDVRFVHIDLGQRVTAQAAAAAIAAEEGRWDVLVNNAGITDRADEPPSRADLDSVRRVFDNNFFGTLAVTKAMLPLIRKSNAGRIGNVSSGLGQSQCLIGAGLGSENSSRGGSQIAR